MKRGVTIAILTRNGGGLLERVLKAIAAQKTARRVEILAVDSGSTDTTLELLSEDGARVIRIPSEEFNFGATRDLAYQEAAGEIVVNLSQDAVPAHDRWLDNLLAPIDAGKFEVACGCSIPDPYRACGQFPWERNGYFYFTREMRQFAKRYGRGLSFSNSAVTKAAWRRFRFEPQVLGEDFQLQRKLHGADIPIAFPEDAEVLHHHDYDMPGLYARCCDEGQALAELGCAYSALDCARDVLNVRKNLQWLREMRHGRLRSPAAVAFPVLRPLAVFNGSRKAKRSVEPATLKHAEAPSHD